jgi:hypothetical protein
MADDRREKQEKQEKQENRLQSRPPWNHAQLPECHFVSPFNLGPVTHGWVSQVGFLGELVWSQAAREGGYPTSIGHEEGSQVRQRRTVDGLPDYVGEHHVGMEVVLHRMGDHDRSCTGHRNDGEEVRP